ncbi:chorion class CB protein M5H4-like isoform X2 [Maniola jurtina]|uniref:chorion class CB protein M5H4-like isoform X2 n=1 Tax=Maniola jurtina TaxID=191418 RepID=UPI001E68BA04|nr:chorion class CB protein M5H4-like isoform X2 [Maniola jurtina]
MGFKVVCALVSAIMIQTIFGQCLRAPYPAIYPNEIAAANLAAEALPLALPAYNPIAANALAYEVAAGPGIPGLTMGLSLAELSASNGPGLRVNSASPMASTGVTVETDKMIIEGPLAVTGQLPFLGVVALEGPLAATGTGAVAYECGNGNVGIVSEGLEPAPVLTPAYPNGPLAAYPNMPLAQAYPNMPLAQAYPNMPLAPGYPNMQLAPGFPNAGLGPFANGLAPGLVPTPQA